jgi:hypothetical protein
MAVQIFGFEDIGWQHIQREHGFAWVAMSTSKQFAWRLCAWRLALCSNDSQQVGQQHMMTSFWWCFSSTESRFPG